jgi:hypothetical protein
MKVVLWLVPLLLVPQEDSEKQKRVYQALKWFADKDPEVSQSGRAELVALGKDAVVVVERKLAEKGALELARLFRDLDHTAPAPEPYVLPEPDTANVKIDKDASDKYIHVKYAEALAFAKKGQYQRGFDMAKAILALEPRSAITDRVNQLRRYSEAMITQTTLIEAKLIQEKLAYVAGEPVTLTVRLKNVFKQGISIHYEPAPGKLPEGMAVVEIVSSISTLSGDSTSANRHTEFSFEGEIPLATGGQWERKFQVVTVFGLSDDYHLQTVTVNASMQPSKIDTDGVNITRKLQFEPAVFKLVPKRYAHFIENPLEWLSKTIETDRPPQETYICAQLLAGEDRKKGTEVLIKAMEKTENPEYRPTLASMLTELTGEKFGADAKKWSDWLAKQAQEPKKKK